MNQIGIDWIICEIYTMYPEHEKHFYKEITGCNNSSYEDAIEMLQILRNRNPEKTYRIFIS